MIVATGEAGPLDDLIGHSVTYRIAVGPKSGQKLFTLQTVPPRLPGLEGDANVAARAGAAGTVEAAKNSTGRGAGR